MQKVASRAELSEPWTAAKWAKPTAVVWDKQRAATSVAAMADPWGSHKVAGSVVCSVVLSAAQSAVASAGGWAAQWDWIWVDPSVLWLADHWAGQKVVV
jgi:hypothetical protein